jgi:hypothetical protein
VRTKRGPRSAVRTSAAGPIHDPAASSNAPASAIDSRRSTRIRHWATETRNVVQHANTEHAYCRICAVKSATVPLLGARYAWTSRMLDPRMWLSSDTSDSGDNEVRLGHEAPL